MAEGNGNGHDVMRTAQDFPPWSRADLMSPLIGRAEFGDRSGYQFMGRRDLYRALGYRHFLTSRDYWDRYRRGGIAKRIIETFPHATWRSGGELIEDENPDVSTDFEEQWEALNKRLRIWSVFERADILNGLGHFAIILLGAPGNPNDPLESCKPDDLKYLTPFSERDIIIESYETDASDERFGLPLYYDLTRMASTMPYAPSLYARVHWTRVLHIAEGALDNPLFGQPRLEAVWNYLDDLVKVVGGGSEAFWKRVDGGKQLKLDPSMPIPTKEQTDALHVQIEEYTHELRRILTTRGVDIQDLGSQVANFGPQVASIFDLISATTGIPQRILMGSERGELASSQDQSNFDDRVMDRRTDFAEPMVVRPFIDRMIELGVLPEPDEYEVRWPEIKNLDDAQRMSLAEGAARLNKMQSDIVVQSNEIRDRILGFPPFTPEQEAENEKKRQEMAALQPQGGGGKIGGGGEPIPAIAELNLDALEHALIDDDLELAEAIVARALGSAKSGNYGHKGRPGQVGGSAKEAGDSPDVGGMIRPVPIKVNKVKDAIPLILAGKVVELKNPGKVHVLMTRLAAIAKDAEKKGEKAPMYDACNIVVKGTSFFCGQHLTTKEYPNGMPRIVMPQFAGVPQKGSRADLLPRDAKGNVDAGPEFLEHLKRLGIRAESVELRSDSLKPSQAQLDGVKIARRMAKEKWMPSSPIFTSRDGYVVDGHHRWAAIVGRDAKDGHLEGSKLRALRIDAPITEILHIANKWTKAFGLARKVAGSRAAEAVVDLFGDAGATA